MIRGFNQATVEKNNLVMSSQSKQCKTTFSMSIGSMVKTSPGKHDTLTNIVLMLGQTS